MSIDEYLLAFESILYGLIVSKILVKWSQMVKEKLLHIHWGYILFTVNVFLLIVNMFWANKNHVHYEGVNTPLSFLLYIVIPPSLFTFMTYQMFPDSFVNVNLKEFLLSKRRLIFIPWSIYLAYEVIVLYQGQIKMPTIMSMLLLVLTVLISASKRQVWIYIFLVIHTLLMTFAYARPYLMG